VLLLLLVLPLALEAAGVPHPSRWPEQEPHSRLLRSLVGGEWDGAGCTAREAGTARLYTTKQ
jgi:hypothetical protein